MSELKTAPDFTLPDQYGNDFHLYDNLKNRVMLVFYPKDNTMVCTKQLCNYRDNFDEFIKLGIQPVAISVDDTESHKQFAGKYNLNFPVLSDKDKKVSISYNALSFVGISKRKIVLINKEAQIIFEDTVAPVFYRKTDNLLKIIKMLY